MSCESSTYKLRIQSNTRRRGGSGRNPLDRRRACAIAIGDYTKMTSLGLTSPVRMDCNFRSLLTNAGRFQSPDPRRSYFTYNERKSWGSTIWKSAAHWLAIANVGQHTYRPMLGPLFVNITFQHVLETKTIRVNVLLMRYRIALRI